MSQADLPFGGLPVDTALMSDFASVRAGGRPAVFRGLVADWPAVGVAQEGDVALAEYLSRHDSGRPAGVYVAEPRVKGKLFYGFGTQDFNFRHGPARIAEAIEQIVMEAANTSPRAIYVQSAPVAEHMPGFGLENRLALLPEIAPRIWIGNAVVTRAHYDLQDNIACVVAGRRRFMLFPPDQLPNLYPGPLDRTIGGVPVSMVDVEAPDIDRFPRFKEARAAMQTVELEPGDALYIPYGWWHHVRSLSPLNVLVNYWWTDAPVQPAQPYMALYHAVLALRDLPENQRALWRTAFDYYVFGSHGDPMGHLDAADASTLGPMTPALARKLKRLLKDSFDS